MEGQAEGTRDATAEGGNEKWKWAMAARWNMGFVLYDGATIKQRHVHACEHTQCPHVIMCIRRPWGTVPSLSLSLATVTSSGYGPVLFDFKHCLSLVPVLSCSLLSTPLSHSLSVSYYPELFFFFLSISFSISSREIRNTKLKKENEERK